MRPRYRTKVDPTRGERQFGVESVSRLNGKPIGKVTYWFGSAVTADRFMSGTWPLPLFEEL